MHRSARDKRARNTDWRWSYEATHGSLASFVCEALCVFGGTLEVKRWRCMQRMEASAKMVGFLYIQPY